jgi:alkylation response protein AidB-like acyl-CoA dehydrogenase
MWTVDNSQILSRADRSVLLDSLQRYLETECAQDEVARRDREHLPPYDLLPRYGDLGLIHFATPNVDGNEAFDWTMVLDIQLLLAGHAYFLGSIYNRLISFSVLPVAINGNQDQRAVFLPKFLRGECFFGLALTEPEAGTSLKQLQTELICKDGKLFLTGLKHWISDAKGASHLIVICKDQELEGRRRVTAVLVPTNSVGISMMPMSKVGNNCMPSFQVQFDDVLVEPTWIIGGRGDGMGVLSSTLRYSRASLAATCPGSTLSTLEHAKQYVNARLIGRKRLAEFQVHRHKLVDFFTRAHQINLLLREIASQFNGAELQSDKGDVPLDVSASMAKVLSTELLQEVSTYCMHIQASSGYDAGSVVSRVWRDSRLFSFGEGANEMHRDSLAKFWLD